MTARWDRLSPFNTALEPKLDAPLICDVTLRDGEQTIDAAFDVDEKVAVLGRLEAAGVARAQVGFTSSPTDREAVRRARAAGNEMELELLCVAVSERWREEIDESIAAGADVIQMLVRGSDDLLDAMGITREFVLERLHDTVSYAVQAGAPRVSAGPSFVTVADLAFLEEIYRVAEEAGAGELVINDTLGVARPDAMAFLVSRLRERFSAGIRVHCHNDFGLALACALAAWQAGAAAVDVAVAGLGERAGNVPLDEMAMALELLYGAPSSVRSEQLVELATSVAGILRMPIHPNKPIVGRNCFAQKIEMHVRYSTAHPDLFEPFPPESVGAERHFDIGKGSGPFAVGAKIAALGLPELGDAQLAEAVKWVNARAEETKRAISDEDLSGYVRAHA